MGRASDGGSWTHPAPTASLLPHKVALWLCPSRQSCCLHVGGGKPSGATVACRAGVASSVCLLLRGWGGWFSDDHRGSVDGHLLDWKLLGSGEEEPHSLLEKAPKTCVYRGQKPSSPVWRGHAGSHRGGPPALIPPCPSSSTPLPVHWQQQRARMLPQTRR